MIVVARH